MTRRRGGDVDGIQPIGKGRIRLPDRAKSCCFRIVTNKEKAILCGLYLSKFDQEGLSVLGFRSFKEAFNALGAAIGAKPASIKNYRDEFDPLHPGNPRQGWKRPLRKHCQAIRDRFEDADMTALAETLKVALYQGGDLDLIAEKSGYEEESFAKRLITGQAAERYFSDHFQEYSIFNGFELFDVTQRGCGFDFKLTRDSSEDFLAVEVKGLSGRAGSISMTDKEMRVARLLRDRYFLFVVSNFADAPESKFYHDPSAIEAFFSPLERTIRQMSWVARVK